MDHPPSNRYPLFASWELSQEQNKNNWAWNPLKKWEQWVWAKIVWFLLKKSVTTPKIADRKCHACINLGDRKHPCFRKNFWRTLPHQTLLRRIFICRMQHCLWLYIATKVCGPKSTKRYYNWNQRNWQKPYKETSENKYQHYCMLQTDKTYSFWQVKQDI